MISYQAGEIAIITLQNAERHNALSHEDFARFDEILTEVEASKPRVCIITGEGKSFCAGVDFASLQEGDWANDNPLNKLCNRVERLSMPVIAALNGSFVGGGAELAFACDFRVSVPSAKCKIPAAAIGVHYEPSGINRVIRVVGEQIARRLFLGLELFSGDDLLAFRFVDQFSEAPLEAAQKMAEAIAKLAPLALEGMKKSLSGDNENARQRIQGTFLSNDFAEAMDAVAHKRSPEFKGN